MASQNPPFIGSSPSLLIMPAGASEGLRSVRVVPPAQCVQIAPPGAPGVADASSFVAIQAVRYDCQDTYFGDEGSPQRYPVRVNNAISRFWLYLDSLSAGFGQAGAAGVVPSTPAPFEIQVRVTSGSISETIFQGIVTPTSFRDNGLIVGLDGWMGDQYEVWGRVPNVGGTAYPLMVKFSIIVDRLAQRSVALGLPTIGRLTTVSAIQYYP